MQLEASWKASCNRISSSARPRLTAAVRRVIREILCARAALVCSSGSLLLVSGLWLHLQYHHRRFCRWLKKSNRWCVPSSGVATVSRPPPPCPLHPHAIFFCFLAEHHCCWCPVSQQWWRSSLTWPIWYGAVFTNVFYETIIRYPDWLENLPGLFICWLSCFVFLDNISTELRLYHSFTLFTINQKTVY